MSGLLPRTGEGDVTLAPEMTYMGGWNPAVTYEPGNVVSKGGGMYLAEVESTGEDPADGGPWIPFAPTLEISHTS